MICQAKSMNNFLLDVFISQAFLSNACQTLPLYGCSKVTCSYTFALSQHHQEQVAGRTYVILCVVDPSVCGGAQHIGCHLTYTLV